MALPESQSFQVFMHNVPQGAPLNNLNIPNLHQLQNDFMAAPNGPMGTQKVRLCKGRLIIGPPNNVVWEDDQILHVNTRLGLQDAAIMALEREDLGIPINFAQEDVIQDIAVGNPVTHQEDAYARIALAGGGYFSPIACALYELRKNGLLGQNSVLGNSPVVGAFIPDGIIVHIYKYKRVSKNMQELAYNSFLNYQPHYTSLNDYIHDAHIISGHPPSENATVVSFSQP